MVIRHCLILRMTMSILILSEVTYYYKKKDKGFSPVLKKASWSWDQPLQLFTSNQPPRHAGSHTNSVVCQILQNNLFIAPFNKCDLQGIELHLPRDDVVQVQGAPCSRTSSYATSKLRQLSIRDIHLDRWTNKIFLTIACPHQLTWQWISGQDPCLQAQR